MTCVLFLIFPKFVNAQQLIGNSYQPNKSVLQLAIGERIFYRQQKKDGRVSPINRLFINDQELHQEIIDLSSKQNEVINSLFEEINSLEKRVKKLEEKTINE